MATKIIINLTVKYKEGEIVDPPVDDVIDFTDEYYRSVKDTSISEIYLEEGKTYLVKKIERIMLMNRSLKIYSGEGRATLIFGVENYSPLLHGAQNGELFYMHDHSSLFIDNVNICQPKQLKTVQYFNPRIVSSAQWATATWTAVIRNCDTTVLGDHGGMGMGFLYGSANQNHLALLNFKHYGTGLMDAKNPYQDGIMYITKRDVKCYAREDALNKLGAIDFEQIGSLKDGVLTFDGDVYSLTAGYNYTWRDNTSYIVLYDRYTFFIDGYREDSTPSNYQFRFRSQASGKINFHVMGSKSIYSNEFEMHAGDKFRYNGVEYEVTSKDRIQYPFFDSRTTEAIAEPHKARALVYQLDKDLPLNTGSIEIEYLSEKIEFKDQPVTLLYKANGGFRTTKNTTYREQGMISGRGIGHLSYNHSDITMNAKDVEHLGFYRGSQGGKGISLMWNMVNCEGYDESGEYFIHDLPITQDIIDVPDRVKNIID